METEREENQTQGNEKDLVKLWKRIYKERGWKKYAPFRTQGGFNRPYILFKAKKCYGSNDQGTEMDESETDITRD